MCIQTCIIDMCMSSMGIRHSTQAPIPSAIRPSHCLRACHRPSHCLCRLEMQTDLGRVRTRACRHRFGCGRIFAFCHRLDARVGRMQAHPQLEGLRSCRTSHISLIRFWSIDSLEQTFTKSPSKYLDPGHRGAKHESSLLRLLRPNFDRHTCLDSFPGLPILGILDLSAHVQPSFPAAHFASGV